jgi:feruloyl esterase
MRKFWIGAIVMTAAATPAVAQNGYSFSDAQNSTVNYRLAGAAPRLRCDELKAQIWGTTTILSAEAIPAAGNTPAFCQVLGLIAPEIRFEVALPTSWNRRIYMRGNGGFAGEALDNPARVAQRNTALANGFAAVQTNTGHDAESEPLASFALNNLQKEVDYAFRAVHLTINAAKRIVRNYYDRPQTFSYWDGCSTGGRQALMSAQRFPGDFDGIIAGAPVLNFTGTMTQFAWNMRVLGETPLSYAKIKLVADTAYGRCDAMDGLADGLIDDPRKCDFDVVRDVKICPSGTDGTDCLTAAQAKAVKAIHDGPQASGKRIFFGTSLGAEQVGIPALGPSEPISGWDRWLLVQQGRTTQSLYAESFFRYLAFPRDDPSFELARLDFDKDPPRMAAISKLLDATSPALDEFKARGGKIVMYHGWADTALAPEMAIDYRDKVQARFGEATKGFYRLYMVPGMFHCRGGIGPERFDALTPLINWVENGKAPDAIVATQVVQGRVQRSRPLCTYPQVARHSGSGSTDDAQNFTCRDPQ